MCQTLFCCLFCTCACRRYLQKRDYGQVPQYLIERKIEMGQEYEEEVRAKEAALLPKGGCN